jgi:hypothetical protein
MVAGKQTVFLLPVKFGTFGIQGFCFITLLKNGPWDDWGAE